MGWKGRLLRSALTLTLIVGCSSPVIQDRPSVISEPVLPEKPQPLEEAKPAVKPVAATVKVDLRFGDTWVPVSPLFSFITAGGGEVRLTFSKPVPALEIERALNEMQQSPVRGRILWEDDRTLIWQIAAFPQRLDFLLDGVSDLDALPLPGGIPSILIGDPPQLVEVDLLSPSDRNRVIVPPDIVVASLADNSQVVNFQSWRPGVNRWDWSLVGQHIDMASGRIGSGLIEGAQPRLAVGLEGWTVSPDKSLVAGFRLGQGTSETGGLSRLDLVVTDLRGGRQSISLGFVTRLQVALDANPHFYLAWSPDSRRVMALSHRQEEAARSDLVVYDVSTGIRSVLMENLPVSAQSVRLSLSSDGKRILVGSLVTNLLTHTSQVLNGNPEQSRGIWEPNGSRLLYTTEDWGEVMVVQSETGNVISIGAGLMVGWTAPGRVVLIRWPGSGVRYLPPGW